MGFDTAKYAESKYVDTDFIGQVSRQAKIFDAFEKETKWGIRGEFAVEFSDGKKKLWTPRKEHYKKLNSAFGIGSDKWINKKIVFSVINNALNIDPVYEG